MLSILDTSSVIDNDCVIVIATQKKWRFPKKTDALPLHNTDKILTLKYCSTAIKQNMRAELGPNTCRVCLEPSQRLQRIDESREEGEETPNEMLIQLLGISFSKVSRNHFEMTCI